MPVVESEHVTVTVEAPPAPVAYSLSISVSPTSGVARETEFTVSGRLTADGSPVKGATVELVVNGEVMDTTTTGDDGTYEFRVVFEEPGTYEVWARAPGLPETLPTGATTPT